MDTEFELEDATNDLESASQADKHRKTLDELVERALAYKTGPEVKQLFEFVNRFPHIAPYNAMLLHVQNAGIQFALRARHWERFYARRVKPAARPYVILQTMGPVAFVFDLSDTEPIDPGDNRVPEVAKNPLRTRGTVSLYVFNQLKERCAALKILLEMKDFATHKGGQIQRYPNPKYSFHIALNSKWDMTQHFATLVHELGHLLCGHLGSAKGEVWPNRRNLSLVTREFEAEAVAFLVTDRMGIEIGSDEYLSGYLSGEQPLPAYSLDAILKAAGRIEQMIAGTFPKKTPAAPPRV